MLGASLCSSTLKSQHISGLGGGLKLKKTICFSTHLSYLHVFLSVGLVPYNGAESQRPLAFPNLRPSSDVDGCRWRLR
ncbi:hypothetical protein ACFX2B_019995 [Malus domestica]